MTAQEAIQAALSNIALAAQLSDNEFPDDNIKLSTTLPVIELVRHGFSVEVLDENNADILPRLLVQSSKGRLEVECCPFATLALLSANASWDGAEIAAILHQIGITTLKLDDFEGVPDWYGIPAVSWLFPERLSEALSRLDTLRQSTRP